MAGEPKDNAFGLLVSTPILAAIDPCLADEATVLTAITTVTPWDGEVAAHGARFSQPVALFSGDTETLRSLAESKLTGTLAPRLPMAGRTISSPPIAARIDLLTARHAMRHRGKSTARFSVKVPGRKTARLRESISA